MFRTLLILGRVSNLPTVWTNVLAGWFLVGGDFGAELVWILLGVSLLYVAGMTLNDAFDSGWDRKHAPERPIPSGAISEKTAWVIGCVQMVVGIGLLIFLTKCEPSLVGGLVAAIVFYNWLHKRWAGSVLLMGACRALVYFVAASAVISGADGEMSLGFKLLAGTVLLYVAGITLVARFERSEKRKPVLFGQFLLFCPLVALMHLQKEMGFAGTVILGLWIAWVVFSIVTIRQSIPKGVAVLIAGICVIDAAALASVDSSAALVALGLLPITLFFQRYIPAT